MLQLGFRIDHLTVVMFLMVTLVATLIHVFSIGYMSEELEPVVADHQVHTADGHLHRGGRFGRFFLYLSLFCFSMLNLVLADNLFQVFISWELVGICSYLLIGFYFERTTASNAANKAFITNRVGDAGFIIGLLIVWTHLGTFNFDEIFQQLRAPVEDAHHEPVPVAGQIVRAELVKQEGNEQTLRLAADGSRALLFPSQGGHLHGEDFKAGSTVTAQAAPETGHLSSMPYWMLVLAGIGIFVGCVGKSAQYPLHVWLPDAMEGPTPVSALIHAATMVTAGVFMVARLSPLFELAPIALAVVAIVGATTAFFAATVGLVQNDIKRVVAYSTCSQLGYMFAAEGVGAYGAGMFHLFTHASFKALLFLGAGAVIHALHHEQDLRRMGALRKVLPYTWAAMLIGTLSLTGFPFTAGFVSKDAIIEATYAAHTWVGNYAFVLTLIAAVLTSFYSWRLMFLAFEGKPREPKDVLEHAHEPPLTMGIPLALLALGALFAGAFFAHLFIGGHQAEFWRGSLVTHGGEHHEVPLWVVLAPTIAMVLGFAVAWYFYITNPLVPFGLAKRFRGVHQFLLNAWYFDALYDFLFVRPAQRLGRFLWKTGDGTIIDGIGPDGVAARVIDITNRVVKLQTGYIYHYAFIMLIGVALLITWFIFAGGGAVR